MHYMSLEEPERVGGRRGTTHLRWLSEEKNLGFCSFLCADWYFVDIQKIVLLHFNTWIKSYVWFFVRHLLLAKNKLGATEVTRSQTTDHLDGVYCVVKRTA